MGNKRILNILGRNRLLKSGWRNSVFLVMLMIAPSITVAGGLYLNEWATPSMGQANTGAEAWGHDASTFFHNPAAMTRIEDRPFMVGVGFMLPEVQFDPAPTTPVGGPDGGDPGGFVPLLSAFYVNDLSDPARVDRRLLRQPGVRPRLQRQLEVKESGN